MTSGCQAISFLMQTPLPETRIFSIYFKNISYLPQKPLKEYLYNANINKARRNMSKHVLIDIIITERSKKEYPQVNDDLGKEEANELLKNNKFARQELKENISPEVKARPKPLNS